MPVSGFCVISALPLVGREGALGLIWQAADGENRYSLRDLASLPYSKEGTAAETKGIIEC